MTDPGGSGPRRRNGGQGAGGPGGPTPGPARNGESLGEASPAEHFAALRADLAGLEEVCRWQWNLLQRLAGRLRLLPDKWPEEK